MNKAKPAPPEDLWAQMDTMVGRSMKDDPGITVSEFAERYRMGFTNARKRLFELVAEGKLLAGTKKIASGHTVNVYRPK